MTNSEAKKNIPPKSTVSLLSDVWQCLSYRRRFQLIVLFIIMLLSGGAELLSLGSVIPFLAFLSNSERLWQIPNVKSIANLFGIFNSSDLLMPITLLFISTSLLCGAIRLGNFWINSRIAAAIGSDLSAEAYRRTLYQPYYVHSQQNSSTVISSMTSQIAHTVLAINSFLQLITAVVVSVAILLGLLVINLKLALTTFVLFGFSYVMIGFVSRKKLRHNSELISASSKELIKAIQEGLGAIREVILDNNQESYVKIYRKAERPMRKLQAVNSFLTAFPRYAFESLGMIFLALFGCILVSNNGTTIYTIPLLGVLALGAQRLLPAFQQIYTGWALIKGYNSSIEGVVQILQLPISDINVKANPLKLQNNIKFAGVSFQYPNDSTPVINDLNLEILKGSKVGLIGTTGSGKSSFLDLLMGLQKPSDGCILIDGKNLYDSRKPEKLQAWRFNIAHVPQSIYLTDGTIAENIAFGLPTSEINHTLLVDCAKKAQIHDFILSKPDSYSTRVGERGMRLSGGQKQRIGLARAFYKNSDIIILDEATSALDNQTESRIIQNINSYDKNITLLIVAHRLSTLQGCDKIYELKEGKIFDITSEYKSEELSN